MSTTDAAGLALIAIPILFNVCFGMLGGRFDYPDILRRPTGEVLDRFRAGGASLILIWWAFTMSALLFSALVVLLALVLDGDPTVVLVGMVAGLLASIVQFLGLVRWPFLVPYLAREAAAAPPGSARAEAVDVVFQSANRYLGVGVGEHLGYLLTGTWSLLAGVALVDSTLVADWLGVIGIVLGPLFVLCSLEFVGSHEANGWKLAAALTPITYVVWSMWLVVLGMVVLI